MSLILQKEAYSVDSLDLYRVSAKVNNKETGFSLQCKQTKTNTEIETLIVSKLLLKEYIAEELTPIVWA